MFEVKPLDEWPDKARAIYEVAVFVAGIVLAVIVYRYYFPGHYA